MITIRPARADDDFSALAQLYLTAWQTSYQDMLPADFLNQLTVDQYHPEANWQHLFVAVNEQDQFVGVCSYGPSRRQRFAGYGEINSIYLLPTQQRQGIGQRLMHAALGTLRANGFDRIVLWVLTDNQAAQHFYWHVGFRPTTVTMNQGPLNETAFVWLADEPSGDNGE